MIGRDDQELERDDQELESDDHELGDDGNLCHLGIVATVSSQLSQKHIQLAMGPYSNTLQTTTACFFFSSDCPFARPRCVCSCPNTFWC